MKPLNHYLSEVEAPPEVEEYFLVYAKYPCNMNSYMDTLAQRISDFDRNVERDPHYYGSSFSSGIASWLFENEKASRATWVGVLRWLAMEVI